MKNADGTPRFPMSYVVARGEMTFATWDRLPYQLCRTLNGDWFAMIDTSLENKFTQTGYVCAYYRTELPVSVNMLLKDVADHLYGDNTSDTILNRLGIAVYFMVQAGNGTAVDVPWIEDSQAIHLDLVSEGVK